MKIALIGYGKMGHLIEQVALGRGHSVVAIIDIDNREDFDSAAFRSADVAIEFTAPEAAWSNIQRAWDAGVKVVSGSTGWREAHEQEVQQACHEGGKTLLWASNFSVGMAIFSAVNRYLATLMNRFDAYRPSMVETHHVHKLDAPSGTAITLATDIVARLDRLDRWGLHETADGVLRIDDIRRGEVPGIHTVAYDSEADLITLSHDAHSRRGFALGAVMAAEYVAHHSGLLTIADVFPELAE